MPELPEVETTRSGIASHVTSHPIKNVVVRQRQLRWPVPANLNKKLQGQIIHSVTRRGKYLLLSTQPGTLIIHLGMSGSLRIASTTTPPQKHDHVDIIFDNDTLLRLRDPRRFGAVLWTSRDVLQHKLLKDLGVEPLTRELSCDYLYRASRHRKVAIKQFIMDSHIIVGIGNIYANEALYIAGIRPTIAAKSISKIRMEKLVVAIKQVLKKAIKSGGTTLRDFSQGDGQPGYFKQKLNVYGRADEPCPTCNTPIKLIRQGQRASFYCPHCQR